MAVGFTKGKSCLNNLTACCDEITMNIWPADEISLEFKHSIPDLSWDFTLYMGGLLDVWKTIQNIGLK